MPALRKAMILAAGLGTRLRPLTDERPKALVEVAGRPLLAHCLAHLAGQGIREAVVNAHHHADQIAAFVAAYDGPLRLRLSEEREAPLETGGGLLKAWPLLAPDGPFLLCNADILSDIALAPMLARHEASAALATLAIRQRPSSRALLFDGEGLLCGWAKPQQGEYRLKRLPGGHSDACRAWAFSGYQILSPAFGDVLARRSGHFSIIESYLDAAAEGRPIVGHAHTGDRWLDVGRPESLLEAERLFGN